MTIIDADLAQSEADEAAAKPAVDARDAAALAAPFPLSPLLAHQGLRRPQQLGLQAARKVRQAVRKAGGMRVAEAGVAAWGKGVRKRAA